MSQKSKAKAIHFFRTFISLYIFTYAPAYGQMLKAKYMLTKGLLQRIVKPKNNFHSRRG